MEENETRVVTTPEGEGLRAALHGDLTVASVDAYKDDLLALLNHPSVLLDLADLGEIDSCGLQLLLILQRQAVLHARELRVDSLPPHLADLLALYGLDGFPQCGAQEATL